MKILITGDWHARGKDLGNFIEHAEWLYDLALSKKAEVIFIAGDVYHSSEIGDKHASTGKVQSAVIAAVERLAGVAPVYIIAGNHDIKGADVSLGALSGLDGRSMIHVIDEPDAMRLGPSMEVKIGMLPWMNSDYWDLAEVMNDFYRGCNIIIGHAEVGGANRGKDSCPHDDAHWRIGRDNLKYEMEQGFIKHVALGHFHKRQEFFVGALRQISFLHENDPCGAEIYNTKTGIATWYESDIGPYHKTYIVGVDQIPDEFPENHKVRIKMKDGYLTESEVMDLKDRGARIENPIEKPQRISRFDNLREIAQTPQEMVKTFGESRLPAEKPEVVEEDIKTLDAVLEGAYENTTD